MLLFLQKLSTWLSRYTTPFVIAAAALAFVLPGLFTWVQGDVQALVLGFIMLTMNRPKRRTLSIEVGMQNAGLGTVLAGRHFPTMPEAAVASAICCVWHSISGTILAGLFNLINRWRGSQSGE